MTLSREGNAAAHFIDRHLDEGRAAKIAYIDDRGGHSYAELIASVNRAGNVLRQLGAAPGERLLLCVDDGVDFVALFWGALKTGVIPIPINTMLTAEDYAFMLHDSAARAVAVSAALAERLAPALASASGLRTALLCGGALTSTNYSVTAFDALAAAASPELRTAPAAPADIAFWLYSSGSTGRPKAVMHRHQSLIQTAKLYAEPIIGIGPDDLMLSASKMFFAYGLGNSMTFPLHAGATTVVAAERSTAAVIRRLMSTHQPTIFYGVPTLYAGLLADPKFDREACVRLRTCISAGEALPEAVARRWRERTGIEILDGLGSTEALHIFISNRDGKVRYGSSGTVVDGYEIALRHDDNAAIADGELGDLWVRGPSLGAGYWNNPEATQRTFVDGWLRTGDKYRRDAGGYYHFAGRADEMLKVGGIWVSPFEIESALGAHPAVREAAVIGAADADQLIKPKAFVVLAGGAVPSDALAQELRDFVKARLAPYKNPRWIEFCAELPRTATGKIQRFALRGH